MRTIWEIVTEDARAEGYTNSKGDLYKRSEVDKVVRKAVHEVIDHILSHPEYIYVDQQEVEEPYRILSEALYSYEKFDKLKKELK